MILERGEKGLLELRLWRDFERYDNIPFVKGDKKCRFSGMKGLIEGAGVCGLPAVLRTTYVQNLRESFADTLPLRTFGL